MKQLPTTLILAGIVGLFAMSCGGGESETPAESNSSTAGTSETTPPVTPTPEAAPETAEIPAAPVVSAEAAAEAQTRFATCGACHGPDGKADTPTAMALVPKPRAFNDKEWQASVDNAYLTKIIVEGGPAVGKHLLMAANPDLADKPEVVKGLVAMIRGFAE